jgi:hypothetical protein
MNGGFGHSVFLESTIGGQPDHLDVGAQVVSAAPAHVTLTASDIRRQAYSLSDSPFPDIGADLDDVAGQFMTQDTVLALSEHVVAAPIDLEIGAANRGRSEFDQDFGWLDLRPFPLLKVDVLRSFEYD